MSDAIEELLTAFADAIRADDADTAEDVYSDLQDAYERRDSEAAGIYERSLTARDEVVTDPESRTTLDDYLRQTVSTDLARSSVLTQGTLAICSPDEVDQDELLALISKASTEEQRLTETQAAAEGIVAELDLPAVLGVSIDTTDVRVLKGDQAEVELEVANYGDQPVDGLSVEVGGNAAITPSAFEIDTLSAGSRRTETLRVDGATDGEFSVTVTGDATNVADTASVDVAVLNKASAIQAAVAVLDEVKTTADRIQVPGNSLDGRLDTADRGLQRALEATNGGRQRQASNALNQASNVLEAILNQYSDSRGGGNSKGRGNSQSRGNRPEIPKPLRLAIEATIERILDAEAAAL